MLHIISDAQWNEYQALKAYVNDPAPMPMKDEEDAGQAEYKGGEHE